MQRPGIIQAFSGADAAGPLAAEAERVCLSGAAKGLGRWDASSLVTAHERRASHATSGH
jgi:hypothetical protein